MDGSTKETKMQTVGTFIGKNKVLLLAWLCIACLGMLLVRKQINMWTSTAPVPKSVSVKLLVPADATATDGLYNEYETKIRLSEWKVLYAQGAYTSEPFAEIISRYGSELVIRYFLPRLAANPFTAEEEPIEDPFQESPGYWKTQMNVSKDHRTLVLTPVRVTYDVLYLFSTLCLLIIMFVGVRDMLKHRNDDPNAEQQEQHPHLA